MAETDVATQARKLIADYVEKQRLDPTEVERERILGEVEKRLRSGEYADDEIMKWVLEELEAAFYSFARPFAPHDSLMRYRLPFDTNVPRLVSQGVGGAETHQKHLHYSFDFVMPIGTPVLAARDGIVARVVDGFTEGGLDPKLHANTLLVLHEDGTFAVYNHLRKGIELRKGATVKRGDLIAYSGFTGYTQGPHLHFAVHQLQSRGRTASLPIRFGGQRQKGYVPEARKFYGGAPEPTVRMQFEVDGKRATALKPVEIAPGGTAKLAVFVVSANGQRRNVTRDERIRFDAITPWTVEVSPKGVVKATPSEGFATVRDDPTNPHWKRGVVSVLLGERGDREIGTGRLIFRITEGAPGRRR